MAEPKLTYTIDGLVFYDPNLNGTRELGEPIKTQAGEPLAESDPRVQSGLDRYEIPLHNLKDFEKTGPYLDQLKLVEGYAEHGLVDEIEVELVNTNELATELGYGRSPHGLSEEKQEKLRQEAFSNRPKACQTSLEAASILAARGDEDGVEFSKNMAEKYASDAEKPTLPVKFAAIDVQYVQFKKAQTFHPSHYDRVEDALWIAKQRAEAAGLYFPLEEARRIMHENFSFLADLSQRATKKSNTGSYEGLRYCLNEEHCLSRAQKFEAKAQATQDPHWVIEDPKKAQAEREKFIPYIFDFASVEAARGNLDDAKELIDWGHDYARRLGQTVPPAKTAVALAQRDYFADAHRMIAIGAASCIKKEKDPYSNPRDPSFNGKYTGDADSLIKNDIAAAETWLQQAYDLAHDAQLYFDRDYAREILYELYSERAKFFKWAADYGGQLKGKKYWGETGDMKSIEISGIYCHGSQHCYEEAARYTQLAHKALKKEWTRSPGAVSVPPIEECVDQTNPEDDKIDWDKISENMAERRGFYLGAGAYARGMGTSPVDHEEGGKLWASYRYGHENGKRNDQPWRMNFDVSIAEEILERSEFRLALALGKTPALPDALPLSLEASLAYLFHFPLASEVVEPYLVVEGGARHFFRDDTTSAVLEGGAGLQIYLDPSFLFYLQGTGGADFFPNPKPTQDVAQGRFGGAAGLAFKFFGHETYY